MIFRVKDIHGIYEVSINDTRIRISDIEYKISRKISNDNYMVSGHAFVKQVIVTYYEMIFLNTEGGICGMYCIIQSGPKKITYLSNRLHAGMYSNAELSIFLEKPLFEMNINDIFWYCNPGQPNVQIEAYVGSLLVTSDCIIFNKGSDHSLSFYLNRNHEVCFIKNKIMYDVVHCN